jgi:UDP-N-acetylmuramate dehydrogenase
LQKAFKNKKFNAINIYNKIKDIRIQKGAIFNYSNPNTHSCGSFWVNPIVNNIDHLPNKINYFQISADKYKVNAAQLIENASFYKGFKLNKNGAKLSDNHVLSIVNNKNARFCDIIELKNTIENAVLKKYNIQLFAEPVFINYSCVQIYFINLIN